MTSSSRRPSEPGSPGEGDPAPGAVGPGGSAGAAPVGGPRRRGRLRVVLAVLAGVVALLCMGLAGLGYVLYNEETKPDRSAPDVVVDNYLRSLLVDRSETAASAYACSDRSALSKIRALRDDVVKRERDFSMSIRISWGRLEVEQSGERSTVATEIRRSVLGGTESDVQEWQFTVIEQDGWRVCGAERLP